MAAPTPKLSAGDALPEATFQYVPWSTDLEDTSMCGIAIPLKTSEWAGRRILIVAVPGAFTRTCHGQIPGYQQLAADFKASGIDEIVVLATNDAFVQSGWGRFMGIKDELTFISDTGAAFSSALGLSVDKGGGQMVRAYRSVILVSPDQKIEKIWVENGPGLEVTAAHRVLAEICNP